MFDRFLASLRLSQSSRPWQVWLGSRLAGLFVAGMLLWALLALEPIQPLPEPLVIQAVAISTIERPKPPIVPSPPVAASEPAPASPPVSNTSAPSNAPRLPNPVARPAPTSVIQDRPTPALVQPRTSSPQTVAAGPPNVASAPNSRNSAPEASGQTGTTSPQAGSLGSSTMRVLRARECARLDIADRPPDCPPNDELRRLLQAEREPKYRPENAEGFSRNELAWRGVPPPCLEDGQNIAIKGGATCIRFGNTPSRVRSVREICEARGLGGCADAPSQSAVNAAVDTARKATSTKTGN